MVSSNTNIFKVQSGPGSNGNEGYSTPPRSPEEMPHHQM